MATPFDANLTDLIAARPDDWRRAVTARLGLPDAPGRLLDTDLSGTLLPDSLFEWGDPPELVLHVEFQSSTRPGYPAKLLHYHAAAHDKLDLPVESLAVLLRPDANASDLTGTYRLAGRGRRPSVTFEYSVWRAYREPADALIEAGLGLASLAMITDESVADPAGVLQRLDNLLHGPDVPGNVRGRALLSAYTLSGLRHDEDAIDALFRRYAVILEESTTYQLIQRKGRLKHSRATLLRNGPKRFGPPTDAQQSALEATTDGDRLDRMIDRLIDATATGWDDLLATP